MELATLFTVAYRYEVPIGSIMLVSDMPLKRRGIKDKKLAEEIYSRHMEAHLEPGSHEEIEQLKKEKLLIKDAIYNILKKAGTVNV